MPTHFHLVLKQSSDKGIQKYIRLITNSYSHYYNTKHHRSGALFGGRFKSVHIETQEQLQHVVRYIHLNPYSGHIVKDLNELSDYQYSSLSEYLGINNNEYCQKNLIMCDFKKIESFKKFILNQAEYQKSLEKFKHLEID